MNNSTHNLKSPWSQVPFELLKRVTTIPVDLYIKVSDVRHEKIYKANDASLQLILDKYVTKDIEFFYCRIEDLNLLTNFLINDEVELEKVHKVSLLKNLISSLGISDEVGQEINKLTEKNIEIIMSDNKIAKPLKDFMKKGDYLAQHTMILAFISCLMAKELGIDNPQINQKLTYASLLHDLSLKSEILNKLKSDKADELSWQELKKYNDHIPDIIEHLNKTSNVSGDITDLIADHHEFSITSTIKSKKNPNMISQLSALFALADEFCHQIHFEDDVCMDEFKENWENFYEHYNQGNFKKPLECLKKLVFTKSYPA